MTRAVAGASQDDPVDILIVGGGTAGCVLASRLSEDAHTRVLLVEAGKDLKPGAMPADVASIFPRSYVNAGYFWPGFKAARREGGPSVPYPQARVLGGGSTVMGMWGLRGLADDYNAWSIRGATGWGWADVLPFFKLAENDLDGDGPDHGHSGPLNICRLPSQRWPGFIRAAEHSAGNAGWPSRPDLNGTAEDGFFAMPNLHDGEARSSPASAHLSAEVRRRPNLRILTQTEVTKVAIEGKSARGVVAHGRQGPVHLPARHVILSAAALLSPTLLLRSGLGPAVRDGVGANLQNHECRME